MGRQQSIPGKTPDASQERRSAGHQPAAADRAPGHDILALQQTIGNRAVTHFLGSVQLQPKLRIGPPGDAFEQEADRMADAVLSSRPGWGTSSTILTADGRAQRMCADCQEEEEEKLRRQPIGIQRKCADCDDEIEEVLHRKRMDGVAQDTAGLGLSKSEMPAGGAPLEPGLRSFFEPRFGRQFGHVRVHTGEDAGDAARSVNARAFTLGSEIVFAKGEYQPRTTAGKRLLAHELTHVVQQTSPAPAGEAQVQRLAKDDPASPAAEAAPATAPAAETPAPAPEGNATAEPQNGAAGQPLLVEDDAPGAGPNQMRKSEFLDAVHSAVCAAANDVLAAVGQDTEGCPWIDYWFGYYAEQDASHVERAIAKFAPESSGVTSASQLIPLVTATVRQSVQSWAQSGEMPALPEGASADMPGAGPGGGILFKGGPAGRTSAANPLAVQSQLGRGQPLDSGVSSRMESAFGVNLSGVRLHTGRVASALSDRFSARAFTIGSHVAFGRGEYQPGTPAGDALIAHELAHVVQQRGASSASVQRMGSGGDPALEHDADRAAIGAVASLWGSAKGGMRVLGRNLMPSLQSGLRLSRCGKKGSSVATSVAADGVPSHALGPCDWGLTFPDSVDETVVAVKDGATWKADPTSLRGHYSEQTRLLPTESEVTGPSGNTTAGNFCAQVGELSRLGDCPGGAWYMLSAVVAHEDVHAVHFQPALADAAGDIQSDFNAVTVPDTAGKTAATALTDLQALPAYTAAKAKMQSRWLTEVLKAAADDHKGPAAAAEHTVVDPMIKTICDHAKANTWGACANCP
jgi:hypothetical protein